MIGPKAPVQARGVRRVERILTAAAGEIARVGTGALTMNSVALAAGTSPGSLYQFFPDKSALLTALAERFARQLGEIAATTGEEARAGKSRSIDQLIAMFVTPYARFYKDNPAYPDLYNAMNGDKAVIATETALNASIVRELSLSLKPVLPGVRTDRLELACLLMVEAAHGILSILPGTEPATARRMERELIRMMSAYAAALGTGAART